MISPAADFGVGAPHPTEPGGHARSTAPRATRDVRLSILLWSAAGGAFIGLLAAVLLVGAGTLLQLVLPDAAARALARAAPVAVPVVAVLCVLGGAALGYLEGRLKL